jgi:hypothetical protein
MSDQAHNSVPCNICNQPINLNSRVKADERGKPVHELCYVQRVTAQEQRQEEAS